MLLEPVLQALTILWFIGGGTQLASGILGNIAYDLRRVRALRDTPATKQPANITVVLYVKNDREVIADTLTSLVRIPGHKLRVIVIDDASKDNSQKAVKQFISNHPSANIQFIAKRKSITNLAEAVRTAKKKISPGLVITLNASQTIDTEYIDTLIKRFSRLGSLQELRPAVHTSFQPAVTNVIAQFDGLTQNSSDKLAYALKASLPPRPESSVYTSSYFNKSGTGNKSNSYGIHDDSLALRQRIAPGLRTLTRSYHATIREQRPMLRVFGFSWNLLYVFGIGYFCYLAGSAGYTEPFILAWLLVSIIYAQCVFSAGYLRLAMKLKLMLLVPMMFVLSIATSLLRIVLYVVSGIRGIHLPGALTKGRRLIRRPVYRYHSRFR
jgi:glycosyltransferase involved in cell wall biosynthesis